MRARIMILTVSLILVLACPVLALGAGCAPEIVGSSSVPADARGVFVQGDHAYVADTEYGLYVLDISNPASPALLGSLKMGHGATSILVSSLYAFLVDGAGYLWIVNINNPAQPSTISSVYLGADSGWLKPFETGGYVHVGNSGSVPKPAGIWAVVDVRDPAAPHVGYASPESFEAERFWSFFVADGTAYTRELFHKSYTDFSIYDLKNPASPKWTSSQATNCPGTAIYVSGGYIYRDSVCHNSIWRIQALRIMPVSGPSSGHFVGSAAMPYCETNNIQVQGGFAYVSTSDCKEGSPSVYVYDVGDPTRPGLAGATPMPGHIYDLYQSGDHLFAAAGSHGLQVISLSDSAAPAVIGSVDVNGTPQAVDIQEHVVEEGGIGAYVYVAAQESGLRVAYQDYSSQAASVVGQVSTPGLAKDVSVYGHYAYVADQGHGLQVVDIKVPTFPSIVGSADTPDNMPNSVYATSGYAYMANGDHGLIIFDVKSPANPTQVGVFKTSASALDVHVINKYAYVTTSEGLEIVDVSSPSAPVRAGWVKINDAPTSAQYSGGHVYILYSHGMAIIDVSEPAKAKVVGTYSMAKGPSRHLSVLGRHAYIADDHGGLQIVDISDPAKPVLFKTVASTNAWLGVRASSPNVYLVGTRNTAVRSGDDDIAPQGTGLPGIIEAVQACLY